MDVSFLGSVLFLMAEKYNLFVYVIYHLNWRKNEWHWSWSQWYWIRESSKCRCSLLKVYC